ncbi:serine/threonine-protein kinase RsbW [Lewinella aquimaris]|uniref:Serine/threonine-protein kinase RsbW n=1 Tax=Neolewinella aquimaris TaxID=1835722 RepID=A0A840DZS7_9BACT|nr:ATP-binding protein [Neolewinella aquimaris]MBB4078774.1 serine/threonine-protein kinase RsbW [Neolewinella aquimaris]
MLTLASDPNNLNKVEQLVEKLASRYQLNQEKHDSLLISLTEAVSNAIIHGNKQDRSKTVSIRCAQVTDGLAIRVSDQGGGFNYNSLPDPTCPERICECGGRGVFLMNQLCDRMRYTNGGSTVEMRFRL